jgi:hypothetical protein
MCKFHVQRPQMKGMSAFLFMGPLVVSVEARNGVYWLLLCSKLELGGG